MPAKYPGPDLVHVTKYFAQANATPAIFLLLRAKCALSRASLTMYPILFNSPSKKHLKAMALLSYGLSGSGKMSTGIVPLCEGNR